MGVTRHPMLKPIILSQALHIFLPLLVSMLVQKHSNQFALHGHSWCILLNFDGIHYFQNEYRFQQNHAFLPLFVTTIKIMKSFFGDTAAVFLVVVVNRLLFVLSAWEIRQILIKINGGDKSKAEMGAIIFLFNPASIFFHVVYTESLFCFITCKAIRYALEGQILWKIAFLLSLGVSLRSNGLFLAPIIGLEILSNFTTSIKEVNIQQSLRQLFKGITVLLIMVAPFIHHLIFSYLNMCPSANFSPLACDQTFPNLYSYVQAKYWNVGLFSYFQSSNALFIGIGTPAIIFSIYGAVNLYQKNWNLTEKGIYLSFAILLVMTVCFTNIQSSTRFFSTHPIFYYILSQLSSKFNIIRFWIVFYCIIGIFLFTVGFPWT